MTGTELQLYVISGEPHCTTIALTISAAHCFLVPGLSIIHTCLTLKYSNIDSISTTAFIGEELAPSAVRAPWWQPGLDYKQDQQLRRNSENCD